MSSFSHLHLHTQYSLLDGANKITDVVELARSLNQPAMAITDHGNMHGVIEFYRSAKAAGLKPVIGCELYLNPVSRFERKPKGQGGSPTHHLTVLAMNMEGYHNLCRLATLGYREGFYFKPRVDHELLKIYNSGLIAMSGCLSGELNRFVRLEDISECRRVLERYLKTFGERFYLEVQPHQLSDQVNLNKVCFDLADELGVPLVATNDCHYTDVNDHYAQEVLMCISTGKLITDPDRLRHEGVHLHLKTEEEMLEGLKGFVRAGEAIANTEEIAEKCTVDFDFKTHYMPRFESTEDCSLDEMMGEWARRGLEKRLSEIEERKGKLDTELKSAYRERVEEEISLIVKMGFSGYFLIVADFITWAKEHGIPVGPGRGSCAGSLVAYAMRITEIDPIVNKLLFERFLNPDRISLPDIDVDFCINGRDEVIRYVVEKYGKDRVAQIATFGTLKAKAVIKDVGRVLGLSYAETDRIAQLVPAPRQGFDYPLIDALKMEKRLADYAKGEGKELIKIALKLEGLVRHSSTHAAGVVIGDRPLFDMLPLMVDKDGNEITQYSMKAVEKIGLVKFDFLGLKTLTVIHTALRLIKESRGVEIDLEWLPLDDKKTYALLCSGNTTGIFQLESSGIADVAKRLKPSCFDDITAILALYRPGPLDAGMVDHYIERKHGKESVTYLHPSMKAILSDTYGIIVYQEQIMQLARELADYSLGEADLLRRAMGKKNPEEMAKHRTIFVERAVSKGIEERLASEIFDQMETFARYGFNRSHSAAYALISYQTAYLKAHYKVEFMAALMSHEMGDSDKTLKNLNECRSRNIKVLPPDINSSSASFTVEEGSIRFGLEAVKGIGAKAVEKIMTERKAGGDFEDFEDFVKRVDYKAVNRKVAEGLVKCGAFDFSGVSRREIFERLDDILSAGHSFQKDRETNQIALFGEGSGFEAVPKRRTNMAEWPVNQKLAYEREALGFYISGHPLEKFRKELKRLGAQTTADVEGMVKSRNVRLSGVITALKLKNTKKGDRYATFMLEDWLGALESIVWPDVYREVSRLIIADDPVLVSGRVDIGDERRTLIVDKIESLIEIRDKTATQGVIELQEDECEEACIEALPFIFSKYPGTCPVRVCVEDVSLPLVLKDEKCNPITVAPSEELCEELEQLFGRPVLSFV